MAQRARRRKLPLSTFVSQAGRFWCDRGREALVLAARLSAGPESRLPASFPVATLAVSTQSRLFVTYAAFPPGPKGAGEGSGE
jgi:hypothetical protein